MGASQAPHLQLERELAPGRPVRREYVLPRIPYLSLPTCPNPPPSPTGIVTNCAPRIAAGLISSVTHLDFRPAARRHCRPRVGQGPNPSPSWSTLHWDGWHAVIRRLRRPSPASSRAPFVFRRMKRAVRHRGSRKRDTSPDRPPLTAVPSGCTRCRETSETDKALETARGRRRSAALWRSRSSAAVPHRACRSKTCRRRKDGLPSRR